MNSHFAWHLSMYIYTHIYFGIFLFHVLFCISLANYHDHDLIKCIYIYIYICIYIYIYVSHIWLNVADSRWKVP